MAFINRLRKAREIYAQTHTDAFYRDSLDSFLRDIVPHEGARRLIDEIMEHVSTSLTHYMLKNTRLDPEWGITLAEFRDEVAYSIERTGLRSLLIRIFGTDQFNIVVSPQGDVLLDLSPIP